MNFIIKKFMEIAYPLRSLLVFALRSDEGEGLAQDAVFVLADYLNQAYETEVRAFAVQQGLSAEEVVYGTDPKLTILTKKTIADYFLKHVRDVRYTQGTSTNGFAGDLVIDLIPLRTSRKARRI